MSLDKHLVALTSPASFAAEQYQGLRLKVERLRETRDIRVIAITSPGGGEGKTLTSINLAGALARGSDARVLVIDADLRRPAVSKHLGLPENAAGLAELIMRETGGLREVTHQPESFDLSVVPAGSASASVHKILRSARLEQLIQEARASYDYVVIDTAPLMPVFDAALLARSVDGVLLVVAANRTPRKMLEEAFNLLEASTVLGIVFNGDEKPFLGYSRSNRYYHQYFQEPATTTSERVNRPAC